MTAKVEGDKEISEILESLNLGDLLENFRREKVTTAIVPLLDDDQLTKLGVESIGDRARLRAKCQDAEKSKRVSQEVKRIMGKSSSGLNFTLPSSASASGVTLIDRNPKRKSKKSLAEEIYAPSSKKGRVSSSKGRGKSKAVTTQKILQVFKYSGTDASKRFTRCEKDIIFKGIFPLAASATEQDIRRDIADLLSSSRSCHQDLSACTPYDFEFVQVSGKVAWVLEQPSGFEWNGEALKRICPSGSLYIRLTYDFSLECDDNTLPVANLSKDSSVIDLTHAENVIGQSTSSSSQTSELSHPAPTTTNSLSEVDQSATSTQMSAVPSASTQSSEMSAPTPTSNTELPSVETATVSAQLSESENANGTLYDLYLMFPETPSKGVDLLYELGHHHFSVAMECLLTGPSLDSLLSLAKSKINGGIRKEKVDPDELVNDAFAIYKSPDFNLNEELRIRLKSQPAIDTGGVRRQFFTQLFETLAYSQTYRLFDGPPGCLRPRYNMVNCASGMFRLLGRMVGHSILLDGIGFPFLSPVCYWYIARGMEAAESYLCDDDLGSDVVSIMHQFSKATTEEEVRSLIQDETVLDLMSKSGCETLSLHCKDEVLQSIVIHEGLSKYQPFLDSFASGLEQSEVLGMIRAFPTQFKPLFVGDDEKTPEKVLNLIQLPGTMDDAETQVYTYFCRFIQQCSSCELEKFLVYATGSKALQRNRIMLTFDAVEGGVSIVASTCGKRLTLSSLINDETAFVASMKALISSSTFTTV